MLCSFIKTCSQDVAIIKYMPTLIVPKTSNLYNNSQLARVKQ